MKQFKRHISLWLAFVMLSCSLAVGASAASAPMTAQAAALRISKKKLVLNKGNTYQLSICDTEGDEVWDWDMVWRSSNPAVAKVDYSGEVMARKAGKAKITVELERRVYTCNVTVEAPKINKKKATLKVGGTCQLKMKNTRQKPRWTSSNRKVATVSAKGKVSAKKAGTARVSATVNGDKFTCKVTVKAVKPKSSGTAAKAAREKLKKYIAAHGVTNSDGNKFIKVAHWVRGHYNQFAIIYDRGKKEFTFVVSNEGDGNEAALQMILPDRDTTYSAVKCAVVFSFGEGFVAEGTVNIKTYTKGANISFRITDPTYYPPETYNAAANLASTIFKLGMAGWELLLLEKKVGVTMNDLGFSAYH